MKYIKYYEDIDFSIKNIHRNNSNEITISEPIIPDALMVISNNPKAIKFSKLDEYKIFADKQKYFSAYHSHCFYSKENQEYFHMNGSMHKDKSEILSSIVFNTGREIVQVWDEKNQIGYVIPGKY
jgi:hypothetical protein